MGCRCLCGVCLCTCTLTLPSVQSGSQEHAVPMSSLVSPVFVSTTLSNVITRMTATINLMRHQLYAVKQTRSLLSLSYHPLCLAANYNSYQCTFDSSLCDFTNSPSDDFNWVSGQGQTFSTGTGPGFDHTTDSVTGKWIDNVDSLT